MADVEAYVFFCEDVRDETGNKNSYMGVFGPRVYIDESPAMLNMSVAAFCRFKDQQTRTGKMNIEFINAPEGVSSPKPTELEFSPPAGEEPIWTTNIVGKFLGVRVQYGMRIKATLTVGEEDFVADLLITEPGPNDSM